MRRTRTELGWQAEEDECESIATIRAASALSKPDLDLIGIDEKTKILPTVTATRHIAEIISSPAFRVASEEIPHNPQALTRSDRHMNYN